VNPRIGIREVAAAAGVSVTTVSHSLNGKGRLPERTRQHVREVAERLGYRPNAAARSLAGGKTGLLGLVISQEAGLEFSVSDIAYFGQLMAGATTAAMERGYALALTPPDLDPTLGGRLPLDGAVVVDPTFGDPTVAALRDAGVPVVTNGRVLDSPADGAWVDNDYAAGANAMFEHLTRHGARRIALLSSRPLISYLVDTEHAYREWCDAHGSEPLIAYVSGGLTESAGFAAASELLARDSRPDAIYATYDRLGLGALLAADANGIAVPSDLIVAACTDSAACRNASPSLTALNLHAEEIGREAVRLLVDLVEDAPPDGAAAHVRLPTRVVARASTRRGG
jgi:DNA-binding LacI/PurR family transcriptional regulator